MEEISTRIAHQEDAKALADLSAQLGYPTTISESADRLARVLGSSDNKVIVACRPDGAVVGWVHVFLALRIESDAFAELGGFVVDELYRGHGVGRLLLEAAEDWVQNRGVGNLRVRSRLTRIEARRFYERMGFSATKEQTVFDKNLALGGPKMTKGQRS